MPTNIQLSLEFGVSVLQQIVEAGYDFLKKEQQKRDMFRKATERYVQGLIDRYSEVKVLGMHRPVPLLSLYVRANILEKIRARSGAKVEELEEFFDFDRRTFGKKVETTAGEEIANQLQRFIVLGKPGAGKTTFLKYLSLAMVHQQSLITHRRLPIFVTLRDWADKKCSLLDYIIEQFDSCGFEQAGYFVENTLKQGKCLILLDGLDEVSEDASLDSIIREIRDFTDKFYINQYVISCRIAAFNHWFERFTDVEMADFNIEQIETFIRNWFREYPETAESCLKQLTKSPHLQELSTVPLLLTLLCITFGENNDFPSSRAELYKDAIDALLRNWDSSRRIRRDDPYKQLSLMQKENMFARIAFGTFSENRYFFREQELTKMIRNHLQNLPAFKDEILEVDSVEVLRTIEAHHGIFVERAKHIHSFAHLTFQEYFTARYINDSGSSELESLIQEHLYDNKWTEIILLLAGMLHPADELVLLILKTNRELINTTLTPNLNEILQLADKMLLPVSCKYQTEARKAVAVFLVLSHARVLDRVVGPLRNYKDPRYDRYNYGTHNRFDDDPDFISDLDIAHRLAEDLNRYDAKDLAYSLAEGLNRARRFARTLALALDTELAYANALVRALGRDSRLIRDKNHGRELSLNPDPTRRPNLSHVARDFALDNDLARAYARKIDNDLADSFNFSNFGLLRSRRHNRDYAFADDQSKGNDTNNSVFNVMYNYLKSNVIIVNCLNNATYLTSSTRDYVLSKILAPLDEND